jgi:nicotinamidase-related amidase
MTMARDFEDHCWKDIVAPEILETYKAYRRDVRIGERPALLAIDLYNLAYRGGPKPPHELQKDHPSSCGVYAFDAVAPTQRLFAAARAAGLPVFYTTSPPRSSAIVATNRRVGVGQGDDTAIYEAFRPEPDDIVVVKERASAFFGTPLVAHLNRAGVSSLIVCGESTSGCVRASTVDAYSHGYHVTVVEECVYDRSPLSHKVNLFDMHHKYADVMGVDEVVAHLDGLRGRNSTAA